VILIAGIPTESPTERAIEAAEDNGIAHVIFDQRDYAESDIRLTLDPFRGWQGQLIIPGHVIELAALSGIYVRLMDDRFLPGADGSPPASHCARFHRRLLDWIDIAPGRVASRPRAMLSNMSKTYQASLIRRAGFAVPDTIVTNDPSAALEFVAHCAREGDEVIYKSVSGARSIVQTFTDADRERLARIRWCPTQFQRKVRGYDMRVHVVGNQTFATRIESDATDYRYATRQNGEAAALSAATLPPAIAQACVALSDLLDLPFTGIDLRMTPEGVPVCFEANPCPAYSYYESHTGAPIARALVRWLAGVEH
jgi:RimK-like ATP-grasp domain